MVVVLWQRSENAMVSFWSFLTDFQIDITRSTYDCFRLSRASFDVELSEECRGVHGWAGKWRIAFVEAFSVVFVRCISWKLRLFPPISIVPDVFL